jgi:hypothetical protein
MTLLLYRVGSPDQARCQRHRKLHVAGLREMENTSVLAVESGARLERMKSSGRLSGSVRGKAPIEDEYLTSHERRGSTGQEKGGGYHLIGLSHALDQLRLYRPSLHFL